MLRNKLEKPEELEGVNLRYEEREKVKESTKLVSDVIDKIKTKDTSETNLLILAGSNVVADLIERQQQEPFWKRRMKKQIKDIDRNITRLQQWKCTKLCSDYWKKRLERLYFVYNKGISTVIEELKQRVKAINAKIRKYEARNDRFQQNRLFESNEKLLFEKLEGKERRNDIQPDVEESTTFWNRIWASEAKHNEKAKWMKDIEKRCKNIERQDDINVTEADIKKQINEDP